MADHDLPLAVVPDDSGEVLVQQLETALTLGTAPFGQALGVTINFPTGADIGLYGAFKVPQDYAGTPRLVLEGILDQAASVLGIGVQFAVVADTEPTDIAFETEDVANVSTWTGYAAEDLLEIPITMTPASSLQPGDRVYFFAYRDDSVDTQTGDWHDVRAYFRYSDS